MGAGCLNHYWLAKSSGEVVSSIGGLPRHMVGPSVLEMQPRGVTGPSCVEVASLAIGNWKFMVVRGLRSEMGLAGGRSGMREVSELPLYQFRQR